MPTINIKCMPIWYPEGDDPAILTGRGLTTYMMGEWVRPIVMDAINEFDGRTGDEVIGLATVWADFTRMSAVAINASQVLVLVNPPEIDAVFGVRRARREALAERIRIELASKLQENNDHLIIPIWEVEVIPEESSGFGVTTWGDVDYRW